MRLSHLTSAVAIGFLLARTVIATPLAGTVVTAPGSTVVPGLTSAAAGTLLATLTTPFSFATAAGTTKGTVVSAVFLNSSGTLDFYYQVVNDPTSATAIARVTVVKFTGFITNTGFRTDGASLSGGAFSNGTVAPVTADRNTAANTVGFSFNPPDSAKILPGTTSLVMVVSTDSTMFAAGNLNLINSGSATVAAFQPTGAVPPTIAKAFGAATVPLNQTTSLTFTITNPNTSTTLTGVAFSDTLPAGLVIATPNGLTGSCGGGTITATAGSGSISLAGATLPASASCTFAVNVTSTTFGVKVNTTSAVTSANGGTGGTASASITVAGCLDHTVHGHIVTTPPDGHDGDSHAHAAQHGHHLLPGVVCLAPGHHVTVNGHILGLTPELADGIPSASAREPDFAGALNQGNKIGPVAVGSVVQLFGSADGLFLDMADSRAALEFTPLASGSPLYYTESLPEVEIGGVKAEVLFSGLAPGLKGVWQINVRVPYGVQPGRVPVTISYEGDDLKSIEVKIE